jgi:SAM-dependent methyltransferase
MMHTDEEAERTNSSRVYLRRIVAEFAATLPAGARVLDAGGGGRALYASLFANQLYETADLRAGSTYVCDLHALPMSDETFEAVLSTQTLSVVKEPKVVLSELHRVLRQGGLILLSAPLMYEEERVDFYRFTSHAFVHLFETVGFRVTEVTWLEGFFGTLGYLLRTASEHLSRIDTQSYAAVDRRIVHNGEIDLALLGRAFNEMDLRHKETSAGFPINYVVKAYKP